MPTYEQPRSSYVRGYDLYVSPHFRIAQDGTIVCGSLRKYGRWLISESTVLQDAGRLYCAGEAADEAEGCSLEELCTILGVPD